MPLLQSRYEAEIRRQRSRRARDVETEILEEGMLRERKTLREDWLEGARRRARDKRSRDSE